MYEFESVFPNIVMVDFLLNCKRNGKKIIITTDMYLPNDVIYKMLKMWNSQGIYKQYFFISGVNRSTINIPRLFHYILNTLKLILIVFVTFEDNKISI